jgi:hypothetical protein
MDAFKLAAEVEAFAMDPVERLDRIMQECAEGYISQSEFISQANAIGKQLSPQKRAEVIESLFPTNEVKDCSMIVVRDDDAYDSFRSPSLRIADQTLQLIEEYMAEELNL